MATAALHLSLSPPLTLRARLRSAQGTRKHAAAPKRSMKAAAMLAMPDAVTGVVCHITPELVPGTTCHLVPAFVEGATCELFPDLVLGPACNPTAAEVGVEESTVPTPVLPSGSMMAEFLLAYWRMLEHECTSGDSAAAAGENVLERVKVGLEGLVHHPHHGALSPPSFSWFKDEGQVEVCMGELEKDMAMFHRYHEKAPAPITVKLAGLHLKETARLLRKL